MTFFGKPGFRQRPPRPQPHKPRTLNWFQRYLRMLEQRRLRPRPTNQPSRTKQAIDSLWRQFRLRRQQQAAKRVRWSLADLIKPGGLDQLTVRQAATVALRQANVVLIQLTLISLVFNAIPARLSGPEWYLQVIAAVAESAPVFIVAFVLGSVSLFISPLDGAALKFQRRLKRASRILSLILLALIPLQIGLTVWLYGQAFDLNRNQLNAIRTQSEALISRGRTQRNNDDFILFLRSNNLEANIAAIETAPLAEVKTAFIQRIQILQKEQEQRLSASTRSTLIRYSTNSLKLLFSLLVFAAFCLGHHSLIQRSLTWAVSQADVQTEPVSPYPVNQ